MSDPIAARADEQPATTAIIDASDGTRWTYDAYDTDITATARRLSGVGVEPGDRVAILSETRPAVARAFFACWRIGATAVMLNARLTPDELRPQVERTHPTVLLASAAESGTALEIVETTPVYVIGGSSAHETVDRLDSVPPEVFEPPGTGATSADAGHDVALLFTSGTTGDPKAVRITEQNFRAAAAAHRDRLGVEPGDRWLCPLSTYHMGGLSILVRSAWYGTTAVLQRTADGFDPSAAREALDEYDCTAVSVVPVMLRRLLDDGPLADSLRFVLCGGAPTPSQLVLRAVDRNVPVCPTYGMTETTSQVATPTPVEASAHPDSVGRPLSGVQVTLVDDAGDPVPVGDLGEIVVDGPTVSPGYLDGGGDFGPHGFHTGDVARLDDDGRLFVLNRREDRILTGGENVHPGEVATVLSDYPAVESVAVLGVPDPEWGEQVAALVESTDGPRTDGVDSDSLREFARDRLAGYKVPKTIAFTDEIPRTASGTVDRAAARDELRRLTDL